MRKAFVPVLVLVALAVCTVAFGQGPVKVRVRASAVDLIAADRAFYKSTSEKGLEGWLSWFAEDAVVFPTRGPIVEGLPAIKKLYEETKFSPKGLSWKPKRAIIADSGELGYTYGVASWEQKGADGKITVHHGKYMTVWRRQDDGSWKVVADIGDADTE
jgi:ketosteroid isomerase-like protein